MRATWNNFLRSILLFLRGMDGEGCMLLHARHSRFGFILFFYFLFMSSGRIFTLYIVYL